jgi:transcription elongation factor GreA
MKGLDKKHVKLTLEGFVNLEKQIEILKDRAAQLANQMEEIALGTSTLENSEFYEMKSERFFVNEKIRKLEDLLENSEIARRSREEIDVGSRVKISNHKIGHIFEIVDGVEANSTRGKVSTESPLGKALLGKKPGDEVMVKTPAGEIPFNIVEIV